MSRLTFGDSLNEWTGTELKVYLTRVDRIKEMSPDFNDLRLQIISTRKKKKLTQRMLADELGIALNTVYRLENGYYLPKPSTWALLEMWVVRNQPRIEKGEFDFA